VLSRYEFCLAAYNRPHSFIKFLQRVEHSGFRNIHLVLATLQAAGSSRHQYVVPRITQDGVQCGLTVVMERRRFVVLLGCSAFDMFVLFLPLPEFLLSKG
jgi:hypothetical protein